MNIVIEKEVNAILDKIFDKDEIGTLHYSQVYSWLKSGMNRCVMRSLIRLVERKVEKKKRGKNGK